MQLLLVHHEAEMGEQLVQMIRNYTRHTCDYFSGNDAALQWAKTHRDCALLITQLDGAGVDGFALGAALSESFPGLQTLFLPPYPVSVQHLEVADTKVFPEPINGEGLLAAICRAENAAPNTPDLFHVVDILQMCCLAKRDGAVQMVNKDKSGIVFVRGGKIVHAETSAQRGRAAVVEIVGWNYVEFAYDRTMLPQQETITSEWHETLVDAVTHHKQSHATERA